MTLTKSKYYFEALDYFPYNLSECMEALNYALRSMVEMIEDKEKLIKSKMPKTRLPGKDD